MLIKVNHTSTLCSGQLKKLERTKVIDSKNKINPLVMAILSCNRPFNLMVSTSFYKILFIWFLSYHKALHLIKNCSNSKLELLLAQKMIIDHYRSKVTCSPPSLNITAVSRGFVLAMIFPFLMEYRTAACFRMASNPFSADKTMKFAGFPSSIP